MTAAPTWLAGRRALVVGGGAAVDAVADALLRCGAGVARALADTLEPEPIAAACDAASAALGGAIDLLVHRGSPTPPIAAVATDITAWRAGFSTDIDGRFLFAAEIARRGIAARTRTSLLMLLPSRVPRPGHAAAGAADGALDNLVKSLAVEWARDGVRVNAIASRLVESAALDGTSTAAIGNLAAYLSSDYAAYITGCVMGVDEV